MAPGVVLGGAPATLPPPWGLPAGLANCPATLANAPCPAGAAAGSAAAG